MDKHWVIGVSTVIASLLCAVLIYFHPERLHAPAWVAYMALASLMLAGLAVMFPSSRHPHVRAWVGVTILALLCAIAIWMAWGNGVRECTLTMPFVRVPGIGCRRIFGLGALITGGMLVLAIWHVRKKGS